MELNEIAWFSSFPEFEELETESKALLKQHVRIVKAPPGVIGYREGDKCGAYVMRLKGQSRVFKVSVTGREIVLYRVGAGETCVITTTCLLGNSQYPASTIVEEEVEDVIIPEPIFQRLMIDSPVFRKYVMKNYGALISDLILLLDEVAFQSLDARLAKFLLDIGNNSIVRTHQQIADELGTAREVVSRQLKRLEQKGFITMGRGEILLLQRGELLKLANSGTANA
ncbi:Crp/Fnr family transcriptional regulator [Methylophilus medardicus]|uniref:Crp/Fnr family transcriptional regulator n=1 Tax=Methylophilus medardicus TaxID=2588534 RepID=A0A5B8CUN8_9PROT|nr:Crp/Fnr family transcriptional regulator [Methylophilus medardicus]QDC45007.1 Crp/Fnr family transcriptional regulator [Methylophilus medardicus]QDC50014.1 Crp/Fnr family transcriptional regulator [Methylophilus medardicus]QDC53719.1 Crp/Fnr family transcriptional regulator [Methylophilus medardicus]